MHPGDARSDALAKIRRPKAVPMTEARGGATGVIPERLSKVDSIRGLASRRGRSPRHGKSHPNICFGLRSRERKVTAVIDEHNTFWGMHARLQLIKFK